MSDIVKPPRRTPVQGRAQDRMARTLAAAEQVLIAVGPERLSIPEIAVAADVPRSSIYQFYPDKYALLAALADAQMTRLSEHLGHAMQARDGTSWQALISRAIEETAAFYNESKLASVLLLTGPFGEQDRVAHHRKDKELGALFRMLIARDPDAPAMPKSPDVATIGVEIVFAVFKYGYQSDGTLSRATIKEANRAVAAYLSSRSA